MNPRVTEQVLPQAADDKPRQDFEFYAFKTPDEWPQRGPDAPRPARAARAKGKTGSARTEV